MDACLKSAFNVYATHSGSALPLYTRAITTIDIGAGAELLLRLALASGKID